MKIQCNVCDTAEANVLCCADEAALCWACDEKVHAANKLASKHQRVPLSTSSTHMPKCDICQEAAGFFFCLEDRALLCRKCDVAIHTVNQFVSAHQRFLLTGVKVGLEPTNLSNHGASSSSGKSPSGEKTSETKSHSVSGQDCSIPLPSSRNEVLPPLLGGFGDFRSAKMSFSGGSATGTIPQWQIDEFMELHEFNQHYGYTDNGSSKADDSGKRGDSDGSAMVRSGDEDGDSDECLGRVPDTSRTVPQVHSPPTASGLYWPRSIHTQYESAVSVPDLCWSIVQDHSYYKQRSTLAKRRRNI